MTAASRDYGLTVGTRDTAKIELTDLGRTVVYPSSAKEEMDGKLTAFLRVDVFHRVLTHFKGSALPELEYLSNTLSKEFDLPAELHEEFLSLFQRNCDYLGIGADFDTAARLSNKVDSVIESKHVDSATTIEVGAPSEHSELFCFVIMPFAERQDAHGKGFFEEVLKSLITPAATAAGFRVRTARRQGSDVIQKTIVNDLLEADLVVADLTEHNPNVMFELGMRMAHDRPIALLRAEGTGRIFDVDNMLRVYTYNPNLWPTTIKHDLPNIEDHIRGAWQNRESEDTYMRLLGRSPVAT